MLPITSHLYSVSTKTILQYPLFINEVCEWWAYRIDILCVLRILQTFSSCLNQRMSINKSASQIYSLH